MVSVYLFDAGIIISSHTYEPICFRNDLLGLYAPVASVCSTCNVVRAHFRFEDDASFHYLKIPIKDHWSQSLTSYLPSAISFIGTQSAHRCAAVRHGKQLLLSFPRAVCTR